MLVDKQVQHHDLSFIINFSQIHNSYHSQASCIVMQFRKPGHLATCMMWNMFIKLLMLPITITQERSVVVMQSFDMQDPRVSFLLRGSIGHSETAVNRCPTSKVDMYLKKNEISLHQNTICCKSKYICWLIKIEHLSQYALHLEHKPKISLCLRIAYIVQISSSMTNWLGTNKV